jgi:hypothetical protein
MCPSRNENRRYHLEFWINHISADAVGAYKQFLHDFPGTPSLHILSFSGWMTVAEYKPTLILDTSVGPTMAG